jgi:hypothetical protein
VLQLFKKIYDKLENKQLFTFSVPYNDRLSPPPPSGCAGGGGGSRPITF